MNINELTGQVSFFDVVVGFFILIFAIKGAIGGFINEISKIFGWVVGVTVSYHFSTDAGEFLNQYFDIGGKVVSSVAGFIALLSLFLLSIYIINAMLTNLAEKFAISGFLNRILGFIFGGGKIFIIFAFIISLLYAFPFSKGLFFDKFDMDNRQKLIFPAMVKTGTYILNLDYFKKSKEEIEKKREGE